MISWKKLSVLSLFFLTGLKADDTENLIAKCDVPKPAPKYCSEEFYSNSVKFRGAALLPQGGLLKKIYGKAWPELSLEYNYYWSKTFSAFANVAATWKSGHSLGLHNSTNIVVVPMTVGVNGHFGSSWVHPYLGIGFGGAYAHFTDHSSFVKRHDNKGGFASLFQAGLELDCNSEVFVDIFTDYRWNWFDFNKNSSRQTGGFNAGVGVGSRF